VKGSYIIPNLQVHKGVYFIFTRRAWFKYYLTHPYPPTVTEPTIRLNQKNQKLPLKQLLIRLAAGLAVESPCIYVLALL